MRTHEQSDVNVFFYTYLVVEAELATGYLQYGQYWWQPIQGLRVLGHCYETRAVCPHEVKSYTNLAFDALRMCPASLTDEQNNICARVMVYLHLMVTSARNNIISPHKSLWPATEPKFGSYTHNQAKNQQKEVVLQHLQT